MISENEWLTRKKRIDVRLKALGWKIIRHSQGINLAALDKVAVEELPTASGPADYGLFVGGQLVGIIEAKKVTVSTRSRVLVGRPLWRAKTSSA
jgi:type I restriction enzyme, R subunit